ncbi:MAG: type II toxin-antitoxin system HicA family toxin [Dissulfurispiraceae bacterium]|jgi:hypothetical protein
MSKTEKLLNRFLLKPKDFTYEELKKLLASFGYKEERAGKTAGSRVRFINVASGHEIKLHKPHPKPFLKPYQQEHIEETLRKEGLIK